MTDAKSFSDIVGSAAEEAAEEATKEAASSGASKLKEYIDLFDRVTKNPVAKKPLEQLADQLASQMAQQSQTGNSRGGDPGEDAAPVQMDIDPKFLLDRVTSMIEALMMDPEIASMTIEEFHAEILDDEDYRDTLVEVAGQFLGQDEE